MKRAEEQNHRRLVHVLDVHWYPEARGATRITDKDVSPKTVEARLQAPRSLWDPTYTEKSWIAATWGKPIRLIPWLQERIDANYPGTKLAMTEYNYGVGDHISGGLAQADVLGVFGREGVYLATYWGDGAGNGACRSTSRRRSRSFATTTARAEPTATRRCRRRRSRPAISTRRRSSPPSIPSTPER